MIKLPQPLPNGLKEINEVYGNPDEDNDFAIDLNWCRENLRYYKFPFYLCIDWSSSDVARNFRAHKLVGPAIVDAYEAIGGYKGVSWLRMNSFDRYGGTHMFRKMGHENALSTHSWGIAIDVNPHLGHYGKPSKQPEFIVDIFKERGFIWGGDFKITDAMHFQAVTKGY